MGSARDLSKKASSTSATSTPRSGGSAAARSKAGGKPRSRSNVTKVKEGALGLLGAVGDLLSVPQQVVFKGAKGVRQVAQGDVSEGLSSLTSAAREGSSLVNPAIKRDADVSFTETVGAKKLPYGAETAAQVVLDPLNFVTLGSGAAAKSAIKTAGGTLSKEAVERLTTQGLKKGLSEAEQAAVREAIVREATGVVRNPAKTATKQMKALSTRARGGVTLRVPGTKIAATPLSGAKLAEVGKATGATAARDAVKASRPVSFLGRALIPGRALAEEVGSKPGAEVLNLLADRRTTMTAGADDLIRRIQAAATDYEQATGKAFDVADDKFILDALEAGDVAGAKAARPELSRMLDTAADIRRVTEQSGVEAGVMAPEALRDSATYMHRNLTPEAGEALGKAEQKARVSGSSLSKALNQGAAKARTIAPASSTAEINAAVDAAQKNLPIAPGTIRDAGRRARFTAPAARRLTAIESEADALRLRNLEPRAGELSDAAKRQLARDEGVVATRKSIARNERKRLAQRPRDIATTERAAARAGETAADRVERLVNEATRRSFKADERRLATLGERHERTLGALAAATARADASAEEAVRAIAQTLPPGAKLYSESAIASLVTRGVEGIGAVATADTVRQLRGLVDDVGERLFVSADEVAQGFAVPKGWVKVDLPKLGTFHAPPALKAEITKFMAIIGEDESVGQFMKYLNTWDHWWKTQVTASLPGGVPFAARNARSNVMLMYLDGMPPTYLQRGMAFQRKIHAVYKANPAAIADEGVEAVMRRELGDDYAKWQAARKHGVIGDGFYEVDLSQAPKINVKGAPKTGSVARRSARFLAGTKGGLAQKGMAVNHAVEQHARLSHFLYSIDRLGSLSEAALRTKTVLFDYSALTPFEQKVLKRVLPFWTFMRKNVPGQFRALVENPARAILPEKLSEAVSAPLPEGSPEYQRRRGSHTSLLPGVAGLVTTPERPFQAALGAVEPLSQLAAAVLPGRQGGLEPEKGLPQALRGLMSQWGGGVGATTKGLIEEATGTSAFTGYKLQEDEVRQRLIQLLFPAIGRAAPITGRLPASVVQERQKRKVDETALLAQLAQMLGVKFEPPG